MNTPVQRLLDNQRTAAFAIDVGIGFIVWMITENPIVQVLFCVYGLWCYHDGGTRLMLRMRKQHEDHKG